MVGGGVVLIGHWHLGAAGREGVLWTSESPGGCGGAGWHIRTTPEATLREESDGPRRFGRRREHGPFVPPATRWALTSWRE